MSSLLHVSPDSSPSVIQQAAQCITDGGVVAVGTESFYALSASALDGCAVARVADLKGRSPEKPILVLIGELSQNPLLVESISPIAELFMNRFWPGPLTLILPARDALPAELTAGTNTVGVRLPHSGFLQSLLRQTGPLTGTSANQAGAMPSRTASEVQAQFKEQLDMILDTGPAPGGQPSTLLAIGESIRILRQGPVTQGDIEQVLVSQGLSLSSEEA